MAEELILIVEDNAKNLKLLRDVLGAKGYQTIETTTGEEGVELALSRLPALILMDIELPGIDGKEALKRLRENASTQDIPVVAVTASAMPMERRAIMAAGFDGFIAKPISVKEFLVEVRNVLDETPTASEK